MDKGVEAGGCVRAKEGVDAVCVSDADLRPGANRAAETTVAAGRGLIGIVMSVAIGKSQRLSRPAMKRFSH
jgi:hypothetical protein